MTQNQETVLRYKVRQVAKHTFSVDSKSDPSRDRTINRVPNSKIWYCDCPFFHYQLSKGEDKHCYHIDACIIHKEDGHISKDIEKIESQYSCPTCMTTIFTKDGFRTLKDGTKRQKYICAGCNRKFTIREKGFAGMHSEAKIITEALGMLMSGMSGRQVARQLKSAYKVSVSHGTIYNWMNRYMHVIKNYTDNLLPKLSKVWSIDEMALNVRNTEKGPKGYYAWLWSIIDPQTKFLIATVVSKQRTIKEAKGIIKRGHKITKTKPNYIISDSLKAYESAIKETFENTAHIMTKAVRDGFTNRPIERYHNEIRENLKTRRGLDNDESAQKFADMLRVYHNYVRPHMGLDGKTPAEAAGIDLDLGDNKFLDLLRKAYEETVPQFMKDLDRSIKYVDVLNDGRTTKVIPKISLKWNAWNKINDALQPHGFVWVSLKRKDGAWVHSPSFSPDLLKLTSLPSMVVERPNH